jgi:hypothetical protein
MVCPLHLYIYLLLFTEWYIHYIFIFTFFYSLNGLSITPLYLPSFIHWMVCPLQLYIYLLFTEWYVHYTFILISPIHWMVCPLHLYIYFLLFTKWYVHYIFIFTFFYSLNGMTITPLYLPSSIHWMVCPLHLYIYLLLFSSHGPTFGPGELKM